MIPLHQSYKSTLLVTLMDLQAHCKQTRKHFPVSSLTDTQTNFASELKRCENALGMGGLMGINAECWLDVLNAMPDAEIAEYVRTKYKPGLLNPFKGTSLYIKS